MGDFRVQTGSRDVHQAALDRIQMTFDANERIYVMFSGGKDSLSMAGCLEELVDSGDVDPRKIHMVFVDEEAIFDCVDRSVRRWRRKVLDWGGQFYWLCLQFKHYNCFNELSEDESFICWDPRQEDVWVRRPPRFAIRSHPKFKPGDTYQKFLDRAKDALHMIGLRTAESYQRQQTIARMLTWTAGQKIPHVFPTHDWSDGDVWRYLRERKIEIPDVYLFMYKAGIAMRNLRISQFFSIDTARSLVKMFEFYPDLYERIIRREPNAYLAMYYWDSEMFRRRTATRRKLESGETDDRDYQVEALKLLEEKTRIADPESYRRTMTFLLKFHHVFTPRIWKSVHEMLLAGDPKQRTLRSLYSMTLISARRRYERE